MKSSVKRLLKKIGLEVSRIKTPPYGYLLDTPRYKETMIELLGNDFRIADSASFYWSYKEIFLDEIYKFRAPTFSPMIVDCGANYGTSVVYFKKLFPKARVIAVEADPHIFSILEKNIACQGLTNVALLNKAISNDTKPVTFFSEGADGGRVHILEGAKATFQVDTIRLDNVIEERIDFLKIDIEGAETEAICSAENLDNVSQLFVEYHSFKDTEQKLDKILQKLTYHGFKYYIHTQFCSPRPLIEEIVQLGMDLQLNIFAKKDA